jgi:hypothetical protein
MNEKRRIEVLTLLRNLLGADVHPTVRDAGLTEEEALWLAQHQLILLGDSKSFVKEKDAIPFEDRFVIVEITDAALAHLASSEISSSSVSQVKTMETYIDSNRIDELRAIQTANFDLSKLIRLCEELNLCRDSDCFFSVIMLTRSIIDHVPPIFGCSKFPEVANNFAGSKSFRESMQHLENSSRKIADQHLHCQIRKSETIPTFTQVNFSNDLDVLLAEIVRLLK